MSLSGDGRVRYLEDRIRLLERESALENVRLRKEIDEKDSLVTSLKSERESLVKTVRLLGDSKREKELELSRLKDRLNPRSMCGRAQERSRSPARNETYDLLEFLGLYHTTLFVRYRATRRLNASDLNEDGSDAVRVVYSVQVGDADKWVGLLRLNQEGGVSFSMLANGLKRIATTDSFLRGPIFLEWRGPAIIGTSETNRTELEHAKPCDFHGHHTLSFLREYFFHHPTIVIVKVVD